MSFFNQLSDYLDNRSRYFKENPIDINDHRISKTTPQSISSRLNASDNYWNNMINITPNQLSTHNESLNETFERLAKQGYFRAININIIVKDSDSASSIADAVQDMILNMPNKNQ